MSSPPGPPPAEFWDALFAPHSIAVVGANDTLGSWGSDAVKAALSFTRAAPGRRAYPVNPNQQQVLGTTAYPSLLEIPGPVDLAIIVVRASLVPGIMLQCVQKGVRAAVVISAGFAETDAAGAALEAEVVATARRGNIRFVGPNCIGHADLLTRVSALGVVGRAPPGPLALISQSGTVSSSIMGTAASLGIGISKFVSTGNEADVHLEDYLEYLSDDPQTRLVAAYVEGLREGRRFFDLARKTTATKPIVLIKAGGTAGASQAARSHTGALAGSDVIYSAAFRQTGVLRVDDEEELADVALALLTQPLPTGRRVGILTIGGGFGVMTAEACEREGLEIAPLQDRTLAALDDVLPPRWSHGNPVDMVGVKSMGEFPTILACLRAMVDDDNLDSILALVANRDYAGDQLRAAAAESEISLQAVGQSAREKGKPLLLVRRAMLRPPGDGAPPVDYLKRLAEYANPRRAARALGHLVRYSRYVASLRT
jgi:acetyltransferase